MKRTVIAAFLAAALTMPALAQLRLDVGVDVPRGVGEALNGSIITSREASSALSTVYFPFPEAALHCQLDLGMLKLGLGIRAFTLIMASVAWPNAFAELNFGPLVVEGQIGGGVFAYSVLSESGIETGKVFFPDLSAWLALGEKRTYRLGGGAMGLFLPEQTEAIPFVYYLGIKAVIPL